MTTDGGNRIRLPAFHEFPRDKERTNRNLEAGTHFLLFQEEERSINYHLKLRFFRTDVFFFLFFRGVLAKKEKKRVGVFGEKRRRRRLTKMEIKSGKKNMEEEKRIPDLARR